ncbi:peroxisomal (S)-2-hydroxy-acid oxidase GLO4-like [Lingula anatina]|uniref:Peroxisomal (S)-2-hydroxy-acid oxidase GLO4-like n=1 Tax=Lingula anatina TaxID=7574 RepID=A0A1S3H486_LINAN|nr:peroxisomal (S)-2-hydroxy-acid oxidase GLO4-like [Lingula anatina]|eukprot:XP_013380818.1 peroxisomal (S)-2-hydroxy-acid oxidase GLO4-like [Lingula anatina]
MSSFLLMFLLITLEFSSKVRGGISQATPLVNIDDFRKYAESNLSNETREYMQSGGTELTTYRENMEAFKRYRLRPRYMARDVSTIDTSTTLLGRPVASPIGICPTSFQKLFHPMGEIATAFAAKNMNLQMILGGASSTTIETVVNKTNAELWQQIYILRPLNLTSQWVKRAENAGANAIVVTVDRPYKVVTWAAMRGLLNMGHWLLPNAPTNTFKSRGAATWDDITWLKSITKLPIVIKGVLNGGDASNAVERGASAIIVSNHGGRVLDGVPATLEVLPEVIQAVRGRCEVYLDSGIRTGRDVFTALALGARAVFVGRPVLYGLTYNGEQGVTEVLRLLSNEFTSVMALTGCTRLSEINSSYVTRHQDFYSDR